MALLIVREVGEVAVVGDPGVAVVASGGPCAVVAGGAVGSVVGPVASEGVAIVEVDLVVGFPSR